MTDSLPVQQGSRPPIFTVRRLARALIVLAIGVAVLLGGARLALPKWVLRQGNRGLKVLIKEADVLVEAQVLIIKNRTELRTAAKVEEPTPHDVIMYTPRIIRRAVEEGKLTALNSLADKDAVAVITDGLSIRMQGEKSSIVVTVGFRGPDAEDSAAIINAVINAYEEFLTQAYANPDTEVVKLVKSARDEVMKDLREKDKKYQEFRDNSPVADSSEDLDILRARQKVLEGKKTKVLLRREELKERLQAADKALKDGAMERAAAFLGIKDIKPELPPPELRKLEALIERYRISLRHDLALVETSVEAINRLLAENVKSARKLLAHQLEDHRYRDEIDRAKKLFILTVKRAEEISVESDLKGFSVHVLSPPQVKKGE